MESAPIRTVRDVKSREYCHIKYCNRDYSQAEKWDDELEKGAQEERSDREHILQQTTFTGYFRVARA